MDKKDKPDNTEPMLPAEPTEKAEATEPAEPMDRIDPAEPIDRIEPVEPMERMDPLDPMDRIEPGDPAGGESRLVCMIAFSQQSPSSRGTHRGSAAALASAATARGVTGIYLQVEDGNAPARALYRQAGFTDHHGYHYRVAAADQDGGPGPDGGEERTGPAR